MVFSVSSLKMFGVRILPDEGLRTGRAEVNVTILDQDRNDTTGPPTGRHACINRMSKISMLFLL